VVEAGLEAGNFRPDRWWLDADGTGGVVVDGIEVRTPLRGAHNLRNLVLVLAVARALGVSTVDASRGLAAMPVPEMRTAWLALGRATLINDAYNANPPSTRAAIDLLAASGRGANGGPAPQRVAVLGTMRELGDHADYLHDEVARRAVDAGLDVIAGVGDFAAALARVAPGDPRVVTAPDPDALWPALVARLAPGAVVLLKASRGVRLERLVPYLAEWAGAPPA
jgi:UDP-N-acetylmuramoyl-tripeptide--D-alanyl-D-alanine ligase